MPGMKWRSCDHSSLVKPKSQPFLLALKQQLILLPKHYGNVHGLISLAMPFKTRSSQQRALSCQSATGSTFLPNESVHISAGLQFAGFRSVVGTMWSIADIDGPFVSKRFYERLYANGTSLPHAEDTALALHVAVRQLRDNSVALERWVPFIHIGV
jgi:hypothetical protein